MKTAKFIALALMCAVVLSSCVSSKKYQQAMSEKDRLLGQLNDLEDCREEKSQMKKQLDQAEKELDVLKNLVERNEEKLQRLTDALNKELEGYKADDVKVEIRDGKAYITFANKLLYKSGSATIDQGGLNALKKVSEVLKKNPDLQILVEGHTDNVPINNKVHKDNWDLSAARANNVVRALQGFGMQPERMTAAGKGEFAPVASNKNEAGKTLNRRTEIIIAPRLNEIYDLLKE